MYFSTQMGRFNLTSDASSHGGSGSEPGNSAQDSMASEGVSESAQGSSTSSAEISEVSALQAQVNEITAKFNETNDRMYRIAADFENSRKRWDKEKSDLRSYCISEFARDLLPVIDSFDKAMTVIEQLTVNVDTEEGKQVASIVEGVQLVSKVLADTLKKHGVEKLPGKGEPFNPNFHNAIAKTIDATLQQEMVVDEFVSGYRIGERILRTAMVRVASPD
ncbi:nucleotide exchange factor GrpE [bacterium]|nr:nucleotide exchange factor GrpE [bacterium]